MRTLTLALPRDSRPVYLRLAEALRESIRSGRLQPGEPLPSTRELSRSLGCHRHTAMAGLDELVAEGWLEARRGQAYRVATTLPTEFFRPRARERPGRRDFAWRIARDAMEGTSHSGSFRHRFQSGLADLRLFPHAELRGHLDDVLRRPPPGILGYTEPAGHPRFLRALATYLRRVRALSPEGLIVTHGSQEAIFLAGQLLLSPGDAVAVEALGYRPAWEALRLAGARLTGVPMDAEGLLPDAFEKLCRRRRLRLLYLTPLHQYPTTVTLPVPRRLALYEIAARHGVPILEDDYDHEFHYRSQPLAPMAAEDPEGLVLYAATFSKILYPAARLGCLVAPKALAGPAARLRRVISRQNDSLLQEAVARWMISGGMERHLRRMRRAYEERRDALVRRLTEARTGGLDLDWRVPDGGMALWLRIPWSSAGAAGAAAAAGVQVQAEESCQLVPAPGRHLRLGFANQTPREAAEGLALLFEACSRLARS